MTFFHNLGLGKMQYYNTPLIQQSDRFIKCLVNLFCIDQQERLLLLFHH